ncbi:MAG: replication and repair protein RecF, partial [Patescibacteria group bacterium]|nr:replication and repair protein RecF [Patescibacteria group bacterium]
MSDMRISGLALQYFRIHQSYSIQFNQQVTLIIGANASGKTSVLEAINLLSTGKSFRAQKIAEIISLNQEIARVKGIVIPENTAVDEFEQATAALADETIPDAQEKQEVEVVLTRGQVNGKRTSYRLFSLNEVRKQQRKVTGVLKVVLFRPEDMRLIEGSPTRRRDYFDAPLSLLYEDYEQSLKTYEQILKRRNKLLFLVREGEQSKSVLEYWNQALIKHGEKLQEYRRKFVSTAPSIEFPIQLQLEYDPSIISSERVKMYLEKEIAVGHTLIGPHKDDFSVSYLHEGSEEPLNIALYGSRGQQR